MGTVTPIAQAPRSVFARMADGLANLYSLLGTSADRNTQNVYYVPFLTQPQIEAAYRSSWLTRKVHDLVPYEMTRAGRAWQADKNQIEALETAEIKYALWQKIFMALITARLHGGSALVLGVLGAGGPNLPLNPERVVKGGLRYIAVVSRHELSVPQGFDSDPESEFFKTPAMWQLRGSKGNTVDIHPSRVITFHGAPLPPASVTIPAIDQFWGDPQLMSIKSAIDNAEVSQAAVATLLHEMKQDVISIPGLTQAITTEGSEAQIAARLEAVNRFKSMFNMLLLDGGDGENEHSGETWETRQLSFAQMPELLREFVGIVAGAADIPATRLMGQSPGGLQSTGKGEQDDFNRAIAAKQSFELSPPLARLDEVLIRSALGSRPPEIYYEFAPLAEPEPKEAAEIEKLEAETVDIYTRTAHVPRDALAKAVVNRMQESGRWPGLEGAIEESDQEPGEPDEAETLALEAQRKAVQAAANENTVGTMEKRGTVTRDMALVLLSDAQPRSLYVSRKVLNASDIISWAKAQGFTTTTPADEMHVTVCFSRAPVDWLKVSGDDWGGDDKGGLLVKPGGARIVEKLGDKGAVVLFFSSSSLSYRHEEFLRAGASWDYDGFQPHITITYEPPEGLELRDVVPYRGPIRLGPEIFEEVVEDWEQGVTER